MNNDQVTKDLVAKILSWLLNWKLISVLSWVPLEKVSWQEVWLCTGISPKCVGQKLKKCPYVIAQCEFHIDSAELQFDKDFELCVLSIFQKDKLRWLVVLYLEHEFSIIPVSYCFQTTQYLFCGDTNHL